MKDCLLSFFLLFKKLKHPFNPKAPRILLVTTTGLGDTLWATPGIEAIKKRYPSSALFVLTTRLGKELLKHNPYIDRLYSFKNPLSLLFLLFPLRKAKIEAILLFHTSQRIIPIFCNLLNATKIIGTASLHKGKNTLLTHPIEKKEIHELSRRKELLNVLDIPQEKEEISFFLQKEEKKEIEYLLSKKHPLIVLHPGAKDAYKCWPKESYRDLLLSLEKIATCYLTGTKEEAPLLKAIATPETKILHLPLRAFAAFLSEVDLFISNDTGPMHLSAALKTKTLALFSPTSPSLSGPRGNVKVLYTSPICSPCKKRACKDPSCLKNLSVATVLQESLTLLKL